MKVFSGAQRARIVRKSRPKELSQAEKSTELNIVPFLDIIVNVLMFLLATIATIFTATIPVPAPTSGGGPGPRPDRERLNITVKITPTGYIVGAGGGFLLPGCSTVGQATLTVPNRSSADTDGYTHDFAGLTQCMQALQRQFSTEIGDDHSINISPTTEVCTRTRWGSGPSWRSTTCSSELAHAHQARVLDRLARSGAQVLITGTEASPPLRDRIPPAAWFHVEPDGVRHRPGEDPAGTG